jgi:hypothetical protein
MLAPMILIRKTLFRAARSSVLRLKVLGVASHAWNAQRAFFFLTVVFWPIEFEMRQRTKIQPRVGHLSWPFEYKKRVQ